MQLWTRNHRLPSAGGAFPFLLALQRRAIHLFMTLFQRSADRDDFLLVLLKRVNVNGRGMRA
jgi:hypothetical protein